MRVKKKKLISIVKLKNKVQQLFNKFIRNRDCNGETFICISCGKEYPIEKMQAGHFFPIKRYGHLRYNEDNVHGECMGCNGLNSSHLIWYTINLKKKLGDERFDMLVLKAKEEHKEWSREELEKLLLKYSI